MRTVAFALRPLLAIVTLTLVGVPVEAAREAHDARAALSSDAAARASAVSGPVILVLPSSLDFGIATIGEPEVRTFTIHNVGDEALEILSIIGSDSQLTSDLALPATLQQGETITGNAIYAPTGGSLAARLEFHGNATNGVYVINASGFANSPPRITPIGNLSAQAVLK